MAPREIKKQVSIHLPLSEFKVIQAEAARLKIPMSELVRRWIREDFEQAQFRHDDSKRKGGAP